MAAVRVVEVGRVEVDRDVEAGLHAGRQIPRIPETQGDLLQGERVIGIASRVQPAVFVDDVFYAGLERVRGGPAGFGLDLDRGFQHGGAADAVRAAAVRALAE